MKNKKTIIDVQGVISKENGKEFTEQEYEQIVDAFIELVEGKNCMFGGGFGHMTEKEYIDSIDIDYKKGFDLAMKYIEESPCDPDILDNQLKAWTKLQEFINEPK